MSDLIKGFVISAYKDNTLLTLGGAMTWLGPKEDGFEPYVHPSKDLPLIAKAEDWPIRPEFLQVAEHDPDTNKTVLKGEPVPFSAYTPR